MLCLGAILHAEMAALPLAFFTPCCGTIGIREELYIGWRKSNAKPIVPTLLGGGGGHDGLVLEPHGAELEAICRGDKRDI